MRDAIRTKDVPEHKARKIREAAKAQKPGKLVDKTFDELTNKEKDELLKEIALRLGLVKES